MTSADYGASLPESGEGGVVASLEPDSPGDRAGVLIGDVVVAVDGHHLADALDWQWYTEGSEAEVTVLRDMRVHKLTLRREPGEVWGITFAEALFDGVRTCANACSFCFVSQLPRGLRPSLYVRDDDFRLSFLQGNFITLTNLDDSDVQRIVEQRLSPLYVSLHAVSPDVRTKLVCAENDRALEVAEVLLDSGVRLHVQIVLVPGVNDGNELDRTLGWLWARDGVSSVGVVPLGYTRHQSRFGRSFERRESAAAIVEQVQQWHDRSQRDRGIGWVYLADEFYLAAESPLPPAEDYDGYPQYENGVGLARSFADDMSIECARFREGMAGAESPRAGGTRFVVVTGELFAPVLYSLIEDCLGNTPEGLRVLAVPNAFFGGNVSVAGLLTAEDIVNAVTEDAGAHRPDTSGADTLYLVPDVVVNSDGRTLDDVDGALLGAKSGQDVRLVSSDARGLVTGVLRVVARRSG